jgi:hypothetical protein
MGKTAGRGFGGPDLLGGAPDRIGIGFLFLLALQEAHGLGYVDE